MTILEFYKNYLNTCEGKDYVRRNMKCISTLIRLKSFLRFLMRVVVLNFYIARQENSGRKFYQDIIHVLQRQHKESPRYQTISCPSLSEVI